jgi:hypothetical protein
MTIRNHRRVSAGTPEWAIYCLQDIEAFTNLPDIERAKGIRFTVVGRLPYLVAQLNQVGSTSLRESPATLFNLMKDEGFIKIFHSGPPSLTSAIRDEVLASVPLSELLKWEIKSQAEILSLPAPLYDIPTQKIRLTTERYGWGDPQDGLGDIASGIYRFQFLPPLSENCDIPVVRNLLLGILEYLQMIVSGYQIRIVGGESDLSEGFWAALEFCANYEAQILFSMDDQFRWKFSERLSRLLNEKSYCPYFVEIALDRIRDAYEYDIEHSIVPLRQNFDDRREFEHRFLADPVRRMRDNAIVERLELDSTQVDWLFGKAAEQKFSEILAEINRGNTRPATLAAEQTVLAISPLFKINEGRSIFNESDVSSPEVVQFTIRVRAVEVRSG